MHMQSSMRGLCSHVLGHSDAMMPALFMQRMLTGGTHALQYNVLRYDTATSKFQDPVTFKGGPKYGGIGPVSIAGPEDLYVTTAVQVAGASSLVTAVRHLLNHVKPL